MFSEKYLVFYYLKALKVSTLKVSTFISIKEFNCQIFCTESEHCFRRLY